MRKTHIWCVNYTGIVYKTEKMRPQRDGPHLANMGFYDMIILNACVQEEKRSGKGNGTDLW